MTCGDLSIHGSFTHFTKKSHGHESTETVDDAAVVSRCGAAGQLEQTQIGTMQSTSLISKVVKPSPMTTLQMAPVRNRSRERILSNLAQTQAIAHARVITHRCQRTTAITHISACANMYQARLLLLWVIWQLRRQSNNFWAIAFRRCCADSTCNMPRGFMPRSLGYADLPPCVLRHACVNCNTYRFAAGGGIITSQPVRNAEYLMS